MSETVEPASARIAEPFPPDARVLHIGLAKTGTTALQSSARTHRDALLTHGVRYPGTAMNHREAVSSLMGRRWGWIGPGAKVPPKKHWKRLMHEVDAEHDRRVWISHEFASEADDENAARFVDALGPRIQVVVTLRPFPAILVSSWQQYLKGGTVHAFEHWLHSVLDDPPRRKVTPSFHVRNDQAAVIDRWAAAAGPDHVTAVVVDKARPTQLTDAFEALFDLPPGFLVDDDLGGLKANRSMSWQESELMRAVNLALKGQGVDWSEYEALLRAGGIARMLQARTPGPDETRLELPRWAAERASELAVGYVEGIRASGVRVIGDLDVLARPVYGVDAIAPVPAEVPLDAATEFIAGTLSAGLGRGPFFEPRPEPVAPPAVAPTPPVTATAPVGPAPATLEDFRTRELAREVAGRVRRVAGRRLRRSR